MTVDPSNYKEIANAIEKRYEGSMRMGNETSALERISTGSIELDYATGGGIPLGRFTRFYGGYSSAKSLTCWNVVREAQKMGMTCAYYNIEKQFVPEFVERRGVASQDLVVVEGQTIEEIGSKLESLLGVVHLHVLDSCSSAVPIDELNSDMEDWHMGLAPRAWGKVLRKCLERLDTKENAVIQVDQVRMDMRSKAESPPGGKMMEHTSSMTIQFKRGGWLWKDSNGVLTDTAKQSKGLSGDGVEPEGVEIKARVQKSRVSKPFRTATMHLDFDTMEFDNLAEIVKAAKYFGVVEVNGSWITVNKGKKNEKKFQGDAPLRKHLISNKALRERVSETVLEAAKK